MHFLLVIIFLSGFFSWHRHRKYGWVLHCISSLPWKGNKLIWFLQCRREHFNFGIADSCESIQSLFSYTVRNNRCSSIQHDWCVLLVICGIWRKNSKYFNTFKHLQQFLHLFLTFFSKNIRFFFRSNDLCNCGIISLGVICWTWKAFQPD